MVRFAASALLALSLLQVPASAQDSAASATTPKPGGAILGTVVAVDPSAQTIHVKEDKTGTEYTIEVGNTRTLLRVAPGAADLKNATRITASDLHTGDRVSVRGTKDESSPDHIVARSVILMSATDLAAAHQEQAAAWRSSTGGLVTAVNGDSLTITSRTPEGPKPITVTTSPKTQFTRYSPATPNVPAASTLTAIQVGDQVRVIGDKSEDGSSISASRVYSGAFRTVAGTIVSLAPDGKQIVLKNLQTKQPVTINLTDATAIHKLPPMMAAGLARRFNPSARPASAGSAAPPAQAANPSAQAQAGGAPGSHGGRGGDLSQMIEHVPTVSLSELKPGDALIVSGAATDPSDVVANVVLAGVEPIFQAAPPRQGQSLNSDWSLDMAIPAQ